MKRRETKKCKYCNNRGVLVGSGILGHLAPNVCEDHKYMLKQYEERETERNLQEPSEAEYQIFGR